MDFFFFFICILIFLPTSIILSIHSKPQCYTSKTFNPTYLQPIIVGVHKIILFQHLEAFLLSGYGLSLFQIEALDHKLTKYMAIVSLLRFCRFDKHYHYFTFIDVQPILLTFYTLCSSIVNPQGAWEYMMW